MATNNDNPLNKQLQAGIAAAKAGDKVNARQLLEAVIASDDRNELAWIWLASVVPTARERRVCLERVIQINPRNDRARQALNQLVSAITPDSNAPARNTQDLSPSAMQNSRAGAGTNWRLIVGGIVAAIIVVSIASSVLSPRVTVGTLPTNTALAPEIIAGITSPTPRPTRTPSVIIVTRVPVTLPPTFTPTFTPTPEPTLFPSATPFPLVQYTFLYTTRADTEPVPSLYQILGDGTGQQPVVENVRDFVYDDSGQKVAFIRDVATNASTTEATAEAGVSDAVGEIFIAPANDLTNATQVTQLKTASAYSPIFSPNGNQLVFVSDYTGNDELFLIDIASGQTTQLTNSPGIDRDPSWSPYGKQLVFTSDRESPGYTDLYILTFIENAEPQVTRLTDDTGSSYAPNYSPDGKRIVYVNDSTGSGDIVVINADGQRQNVLVSDSAEDRAPVWSPDGRFIAFVSNREDNIFQIYLIEPPKRTVTRINRDGRETGTIQFRPDLIFRIVGQNN